MINQNLASKFPFAYNYFSTLLKLSKEGKKRFPQALIFEGEDTVSQYIFALELARNLNCMTDSNDCNCTNCKWIKSFSHPAINNVSQIHFKGENDETKTVISVRQALEIEKNLTFSSDYHRFFIFFSSKNKEPDESLSVEFEKYGYLSNIEYTIEPLNLKTFHPTTPNALLKSIEEPPLNTTFVFLTKSKEDILSTIVSRCLVFKLSGNRKKADYENIINPMSVYPDITYDNAFDISSMIFDIISSQELDFEYVLNELLEFLKDNLKQNLFDLKYSLKVKNDINIVNEAIKMYRANIQNKIVLDTLFLRLARGY